jgi:5-methylcytosine-specific restriction enzyme MrcB-like protein
MVHMATGADKNSFSGGDLADSYVQRKGFSTVPLRAESTGADGASIRDGLETILARYASARVNDTFAGHELWDIFKETQSALEATEAVRNRSETLRVRPSMGQGQWGTIPWIALFDVRKTKTIQRGVYCAYLFREDMSGVYLALAQGVTEPKKQYGNTALAREHLRLVSKGRMSTPGLFPLLCFPCDLQDF